jgi:AcrR family transcriptional regulator
VQNLCQEGASLRNRPAPNPVPTVRLLPDRASQAGTLRRLLEEALIQFGERGFHGVSVRDVADAVGIRPSSLYAHLESKEQLLLELMLLGHVEHNHRLRQAGIAGGADPRERLRAMVVAHVYFHAEFPMLGRVCNRELHALSPANRERVMQVRLDSEELLAEAIRAGSETGAFTTPYPWLGVAAIGAMGIRVAEWWTEDRGFTLDEVAGAYSEFAIKMLS